jgi:hypothetical protein
MKHKITARITMLFSGAILSAQMPGGITMQQASGPQGTTLGANTTSGAAGIALGNRVVMRGYVDFVYSQTDFSEDLENDSRFTTSADVDFLFDFSPVTAEVHLAATTDDIGLEQAFGRYAFNRDFNISFGRQVTSLGFEGDEATDLYSVTTAYFYDVSFSSEGMKSSLTKMYTDDTDVQNFFLTGGLVSIGDKNYNSASDAVGALLEALPNLRKNYVDGVRANFNNGRFGLSLGLHDGYWGSDDFNDNIALDIAASVMIIPGLEARLGYAHQESDDYSDISHLNGWISYKPGDLTLAFEFDTFDIQDDAEIWDIMLMANYQFSNWFGLTLRYSHEDIENLLMPLNLDIESDRITLALLFSVTQNFGINFEYSHTEYEGDGWDDSADEVYVEGLLSF